MKSVSLHHCISFLCLCVALGQQNPSSRSALILSTSFVAFRANSTGMYQLALHQCWSVRPSAHFFLRQCYRVRRVDLHLFDCVRHLALNQCYWIRHLALGQCHCISQFALGQFYRISPFSLHHWCCISQLALSPPPQTSLPLPFIQTPPTSSSWSSSTLPLHTQLPMTR